MNLYPNTENLSIVVSPPRHVAALAPERHRLVWVDVPTGQKNPLYLRCPERLRSRIDASGIFRNELGTLSGLTGQGVGSTEDGKRVPRLSTLERIADALGISPGWIAYGEEGFAPFRQRTPRAIIPHDPPVPMPDSRAPRDTWRGVATRLSTLRRQHKMTLRDVADSAGISRQAVLLIEKGRTDPLISTVERIAVSLDVAPAWLAYGEGQVPVDLNEVQANPTTDLA